MFYFGYVSFILRPTLELFSTENASGYQLNKEDMQGLMMVNTLFSECCLWSAYANIFVGGFDSTVVAIERAMSEIVRSPRGMQRLVNEIRNCMGRI